MDVIPGTHQTSHLASMLDFEASMVWISGNHSGGAGATHWVKFIDKVYNSLVLVVGRPGGSNCHKNCPERNTVPKVHCFMPVKNAIIESKKDVRMMSD